MERMLNQLKNLDPVYTSVMKSYHFKIWITLPTSFKLCKHVDKIAVK